MWNAKLWKKIFFCCEPNTIPIIHVRDKQAIKYNKYLDTFDKLFENNEKKSVLLFHGAVEENYRGYFGGGEKLRS